MAGRCPSSQDSSGGARLPKKVREMDPHKAYVVSPPPLPDSPTRASRPSREFQSARGNIMVCCKTIPGAETAEKKERLLARIDAMLATWEKSGKDTMAELDDVEQRLSHQGEVVEELIRQLVAARAREARDRAEIASLHQQVSAARETVSADSDTAAALAASDHEVPGPVRWEAEVQRSFTGLAEKIGERASSVVQAAPRPVLTNLATSATMARRISFSTLSMLRARSLRNRETVCITMRHGNAPRYP